MNADKHQKSVSRRAFLSDPRIPRLFFGYPASFVSWAAAEFSRHSREQYSESFEPDPIARVAGIHVPHAAQRTSLRCVAGVV